MQSFDEKLEALLAEKKAKSEKWQGPIAPKTSPKQLCRLAFTPRVNMIK
jgi:hypothetical protein